MTQPGQARKAKADPDCRRGCGLTNWIKESDAVGGLSSPRQLLLGA